MGWGLNMRAFFMVAFLMPAYAMAADIKPTFTAEQAQVILNMSNAEIERAVAKGNYGAIKQTLPIVEELFRAAQEAAKEPAKPPVEEPAK
jgi:hypothetical protein